MTCCISSSAAARAPVPLEGYCWPVPLQQTLRYSKTDLAQSLWKSLLFSLGPGTHEGLFAPSEGLWRVLDLILNAVVLLLPSCWGFCFALGPGVSLFGGIQQSHSPVDGYSAASCDLGVFTEDDHMFCSAIIWDTVNFYVQYLICIYAFISLGQIIRIGISVLYDKWMCHSLIKGYFMFYIPPAMYEHCSFFTFSPVLRIIRLFISSNSCKCAVLSYYSFNLPFSND